MGKRYMIDDYGLNRKKDYILVELDEKSREGFEKLVQSMEKSGWTLTVKVKGFTLIHSLEDRIKHSLKTGLVPFERLKKWN